MHQEGQVLLTRAAVAAAIAGYGSSATFKRQLADTAPRPELLQVVGRFIHFCSVFGGCQTSFAGELAVRQDLFRDLDEPDALADNSVEVALRYYVPTAQQAQAKAWILAGVGAISQLAADFMNTVNSDGG